MKKIIYFIGYLLFLGNCGKASYSGVKITSKKIFNTFFSADSGSIFIFKNNKSGKEYTFEVIKNRRLTTTIGDVTSQGNWLIYRFTYYNDTVTTWIVSYITREEDTVVVIECSTDRNPSMTKAFWHHKNQFLLNDPLIPENQIPNCCYQVLQYDSLKINNEIYRNCISTYIPIGDTIHQTYMVWAEGVGLVKINNGLEQGENNLFYKKIQDNL